MDTIERDVRTFIADNFLFGQDDGLKNDDSFLEAGILDSTGILQLLAYLQDTYSITIEDEEVIPSNMDSVNCVAAYVRRKLSTSPAAEIPGPHQNVYGGRR